MKIRKLLAAACGCFALLFGTTAAQAAENVVGGGGTVVEVDGTVESLKTGLETAMRDNDRETFTTVKLSENITFGEGDTWEPMLLKPGVKLVLDGNGKTITGLPNSLFALTGPGSKNGQYLRINDLTFEKARAVNTDTNYVSVILTGALDYVREATFKNVTIDDASVSSGDYAGAFIGYASLSEADDTVTFENCKVLNSTIQGGGSVGALIGHANGGKAGVVKVVSAEVKGNKITSSEKDFNTDGTPKYKAGAVFGTLGTTDIAVNATVSGNTVKSGDYGITTVCGRQGSAGTLTITGGTYDNSPIDADSTWAGVSATCTLTETVVAGKTIYTVAEAYAAKVKVGETETSHTDLAAALKAAVAAENATVEILRDITFAPNDTWTPVKIGWGKTLVINGNSKTIKNLPGCLFGSTFDTGDVQDGSAFTMTNLKFEKPKASALASSNKQYVAVVLALAYGMDVTFDGVEIDGADVRGGNDSFVAGFVGWCNGMSGKNTVTLRNCALRNSTLVSCGSVGGLVAYTTVTPEQAVSLVVENCEVTGNTIVGTELKDGNPRTDIVGSVVGTIGAGVASVSATVSSNKVYGSTSAVDAETLTKATDEVTTVYGRGKGGELTIAGGTYDARPFNEGDDWAKVAKGYDMTANGDGTYGVTAHVVAKVGGEEFNSLAAALTAAVAAKDATVEIVDDITFDEGDTWTPVALKPGSTLVVKGNGKTIKNLPGMLLDAPNGGAERLRMSDLKFESPKAVNSGSDYVAVILGYADSMVELTFTNVSIEGATVTGNDFVAAFVAYAALVVGDSRVTFTNCAVKGSTLTGGGSTGALMGHANGSVSGTVTVVDCEISGNTITCTKAASKKAGAVFGTVGDAPAFVSANVSGNTVKSGDNLITTVYGRQGSAGGTLTLTGGTYDARPFNEGDDWAKVAKGYDMAANGDGTYGVTAHIVAKVGARAFNSLADALTAAITHRDADDVVVKIVDDITFDEGDEWTPVMLPAGQKLVIDGKAEDGSNHVIKGLPASLADKTGSWQVLRISNLTLKSAKVTNTAANQGTAVVLGHASDMLELTFDNVVIDGATVQAADWAGAFVGYAAGYSDESNGAVFQTVTFRNCKVLNSTVESSGSVGALIGHASGSTYTRVVVENAEIRNNVIKCTKTDSKDKAGAVFGTVGEGQPTEAHPDGGLFVDAVVSNNTVTSDDQTITTIYGRRGNTGTLTLTGGTYASAPLADGDSAWAKVDEWCTLVEQDGLFKVVDNLATLGNVKARQRYPWNGLVDITFELKSKNAARIFIVAEYIDGGVTKRLTMTTAKLVNDDKTEREVNVSTGFEVPAQATAKTIHVIWDSTTAVPTRLSGVTFKVYAK